MLKVHHSSFLGNINNKAFKRSRNIIINFKRADLYEIYVVVVDVSVADLRV